MNELRPIRFKNMAVDMTAMCDVAFLLLVFFVSAARYDQWEPLKIKAPLTHTFTNDLSDGLLGVVYISGDRIMYQIVNDKTRRVTLNEMAQKYNASFSEAERDKFVSSPIIGAPICNLKEYDNQYMDWNYKIYRPGIPYDTGKLDDNELFNWIKQSRIAARALFSRDLRLIIKGDKDVQYPVLKRVIDILQKQKVNRFTLMTERPKTDNNFQ